MPMTQGGGHRVRKHRRRRSDGAPFKAAAVAVQAQAGQAGMPPPDVGAGAILSCPFCGFQSAEYGSLLKHVEDTHPEDNCPPQCGSGSNSRLGSSGLRSSHDGSRGNSNSKGKARASHRKSRQKMSASANTSRPASVGGATVAGAASGVATTSVVISGSPEDSDSMSDNDDLRNANEDSQFADCPVEGCHESVVVSEMAYHIDLHAALEYQEAPGAVDDSGMASKGKDNAKSLAATAPRKSTNPPRTRTRALSVDGDAQGMSGLRSQRASSRMSMDSGATESRKEVPAPSPSPRDDSRERHRERREHQRNHERGRGRGRVHTGELGLSSLGQNSGSQQTFLSHKPSKGVRSFLAKFSGVDSKKHSSSSSHDKERARGDRDKEKDKAIIPLVHRHRPSSSTKNGTAKTMAPVSEVPKRLGKAELGKYAMEDRMPDDLAVYLKKDWGVRHEGVIPFLQGLLEQNSTTEYAYLCDPCVQHVSRLPKEGGFCGYRNIQTLTSYIVGTKFPGYEAFPPNLPSVFDLQDMIESAWDKGINSRGRIETGGIRLTRKYIGTPEAVALFQSLNIPCSINAFKHKTPEKSRDSLLRDVEHYFSKGIYQSGAKVRATTLPPIYWQHPGHSLTIIGIEKTTTGEMNLLVFDPIFRNTSLMARLVSRQQRLPDQLLQPYRRGTRYLSRYRAFEILKLQPMAKDYDYELPTAKSPAAPPAP